MTLKELKEDILNELSAERKLKLLTQIEYLKKTDPTLKIHPKTVKERNTKARRIKHLLDAEYHIKQSNGIRASYHLAAYHSTI